MTGCLSPQIRRSVPLTLVGIVAGAVLLLLAFYAFGSDFRELAFNRLQDCSFFSLQPAWNFPHRFFFTFDGENPTYGFQPLWMIFLTLASFLSPDKLVFLRMDVWFGGLFFCLTAVALYFFLRRWFGPWLAVIAPVLWAVNPVLAGVFITGKENALYAFLLALSGWAIVRMREAAPRAAWPAGILLGLMILCRVNALVPAVLLLGVLCWQGSGSRRERIRRTLAAGAGMLTVLLPWCLYALFSFGTVFPNSGSAKLIDSAAALAAFGQQQLPGPVADWVRSLVPPAQQIFLERPEFLSLPTRAQGISYAAGFLPDRAFGSWSDLFSFLGAPDFRLRLVLLLAGALAVLTACLLEWRRPAGARRTSAAIALALFLSAALNTLSNWLLMPAYLEWGVWYAVPELMALILAAAILLSRLLEVLAAKWPSPVLRWIPAGMGLVMALAGLMQFARFWAPVASTAPFEATQEQVYAASVWMEENLPAESRVASYSAGLLGYFSANVRVINIDGLANTPQFVHDVLPGHILYVRGLATEDPVREYLAAAHIGYLANMDSVERIDNGAFLGLVDPGGGILLYRGGRPILWGPEEPERRMIVVELLP